MYNDVVVVPKYLKHNGKKIHKTIRQKQLTEMIYDENSREKSRHQSCSCK